MNFTVIEGDVILRDSSGNELAIADAAAISATKGLLVAGKDGTTARFLKVAADGTLLISATSLPLPAGAATEATLLSLDSKDFATETTLAQILADTSSLDASIDVNLSTRASEATLLSLDSKDFATETTLAQILADTSSLDASIDVNLSTRASEATLANVEANQTNGLQKTQITNASGLDFPLNQAGNRVAVAVAYPEMLLLLDRISAQLERVLRHLAVVTDEEDPL